MIRTRFEHVDRICRQWRRRYRKMGLVKRRKPSPPRKARVITARPPVRSDR